MAEKWIKIPGPGEMRGEGRWVDFDTLKGFEPEFWEWCRKNHYLPVAEQDDEPLDENAQLP